MEISGGGRGGLGRCLLKDVFFNGLGSFCFLVLFCFLEIGLVVFGKACEEDLGLNISLRKEM